MPDLVYNPVLRWGAQVHEQREAVMLGYPIVQRLSSILSFLVIVGAVATIGAANAQNSAPRGGVAYAVKFLCGPSSETFQEGMVTGFAATAVNLLNPSLSGEVRFAKRVSRALPYQASGPMSEVQQDVIGPLEAIEIECNEIRQMLPSQMTEEFRTGYLVILAEEELVVTAVYSARPRDGEISTLDVQRIAPIEVAGGGAPGAQPDLTVTDIDMGNLRVRCPQGAGSCVSTVPVTVANVGTDDAGPFRIRVTFDPNQSVVVFEDVLGGLAAGDTYSFTAKTPPGGNCFDPNCQICAFVDSDDAVPESNEANNQLCRERLG
jgi:CARDB